MWQNCVSTTSKCRTSSEDKRQKCVEKTPEIQSMAAVVLSDSDETDDFDSAVGTFHAKSSIRQLDASMLSADKTVSAAELASADQSDSDQKCKQLFAATSPKSLSKSSRDSPSATNFHSSPPFAHISPRWSTSNSQTTGILCALLLVIKLIHYNVCICLYLAGTIGV